MGGLIPIGSARRCAIPPVRQLAAGPLRVNNGDAMMPALIAGTGLDILPEYILRDALAAGGLERLLPDWSLPSGAV
jgi:DNA-binding transcriptional LysR family regulator